MARSTDVRQRGTETKKALRELQTRVLDGLRHGFFEGTIEITAVKGKRRQLVISAGRSYKFNIPEDEIR